VEPPKLFREGERSPEGLTKEVRRNKFKPYLAARKAERSLTGE